MIDPTSNAPTAHVHAPAADDYIDLAGLWRIVWGEKITIVLVTLIVAAMAVIGSLLLPNIYRAQAVLAPVAEQQPRGLGSLLGRIAPLGGLGGLELNAIAIDNTTLAIEVLQSRQFLTDFIRRHDLLVPLFAAEKWDADSKQWIVDPGIYDVARKKWVRDVRPPKTAQPSDWEIFKEFSDIVSVEQDPDTRLVRVAVESRSPIAAKEWVDLLVRDINERMRSQDLRESRRSVEFLERRMQDTSLTEMRLTLSGLLEQELRTIMLAEGRQEYAFRTVDPAVVPEEKARPARALICIAVTLFGGLCVTLFVVMRQLRKQGKMPGVGKPGAV